MILAALIHGIFCEVIYDLYKPELIKKEILLPDEANREQVLYEYIYARFKFADKLPAMNLLEYAWKKEGEGHTNQDWWNEKKEQCSRFLVLLFKLLDNE